eukprot:11838050-Heterocapsa_arctica.AAC.1
MLALSTYTRRPAARVRGRVKASRPRGARRRRRPAGASRRRPGRVRPPGRRRARAGWPWT